MPRGLDASEKAQLAARVKSPVYFVDLQLTSQTTRLWNGSKPIVAGGFTWQGTGELGKIQGLESSRALEAQSITLELNGIPADVLSPGVLAETRAERYQGRPLSVYLSFLNVDTGALLFAPRVIWSGFGDVMSFSLSDTVSLTLSADHYTSHLRRTNGLRMTTESHAQRFGNPTPRDLIFDPQSRLMGRSPSLI